jgi:BirA family transcriptional regulator, biotin operon repressor / biotin---[acetyl-CoA-carboxylase] ligase
MSSVDSTEWKSIYSILDLLARCEYISGEDLGESLSISRAGVWKYIKKIEQLGINVESIKGKGYRLTHGLSLLKAEKIVALLDSVTQKNIKSLDVYPVIASTNSFLLDQQNIQGRVCLAELQTSGRGRRGRQWVSPFARNIYLSIGWRFESGIAAVQGLSLAVGVAITNALKKFQLDGVYLKWPNDVVIKSADHLGYKKLAGILIELRGDVSGDCELIIGVGLNYDMDAGQLIDQPWIDIKQIVAGKNLDLPSRNELAAEMVDRIVALLLDYEQKTFSFYREPWEVLNIHNQQHVSVALGSELIEGKFSGLNDEGALILCKSSGENIVFNGGEISIRSLS